MEKQDKLVRRKDRWGWFLPGIAVIICCSLLGGCGKEKEDDPAGKQVLEITITPPPTPTPVPDEVNPEAVVREGNLTMVNGYLVEGIGISKTGKPLPEAGDDTGGEKTGSDAEGDSGKAEDENAGAGDDTGGETGSDAEEDSAGFEDENAGAGDDTGGETGSDAEEDSAGSEDENAGAEDESGSDMPDAEG